MIFTLNESSPSKDESAPHKKLSKKAKRIIILSIVISLVSALIISILISNFSIKITRHSTEHSKIISPVRIALISDLHTREYGNENRKLISKIEKQNPELILLTGDILTSEATKDTDFKYLHNLIFSLQEFAPVFFSIGNQERFNPKIDTICEFVRKAGGTVLDNEYTDININGNPIRIGGITYYRSWDKDANTFLQEFCSVNEDVYTILLSHNPEFYLWGMKNYPIDLTLSGHTHGGMIKLPLIGPLYAPEQGWFPDYAAGFYEFEKGHLAITTGLSSSPKEMPRIFNRPEIMIIDLK